MDFLKKAKAGLKDLEGDLNKATAALRFGEKDKAGGSNITAQPASDAQAHVAAQPASSASTPAVNTPSTSVAPSIADNDRPKLKLPLAIRKEVRDNFEAKLPDLEAQLSSVLRVPWKIDFDVGYLYGFAKDRFATERPGYMFNDYVEQATLGIQAYLQRYGEDGRSELNAVCSTHTMTLDQTANPEIHYSGVEIINGSLSLRFKGDYLGSNISSVCSELSAAVNDAGKTNTTAGVAALDFDAKQSIKTDYEPHIDAVKSRIIDILALPTLTIHPNFEHIFAALSAHVATGKQDPMFPRKWQKDLGKRILEYFEGLAGTLESQGFKGDEMMQEGFKDAVDRNEISFRIVKKLNKQGGRGNESVIENGALFLQTTVEDWAVNIREAGAEIINIL